MIKFEFPENYKPGLLLGLYNLEQVFINSLKSTLNAQYKNNINYLQITNETLKKPKLKRIKDSNYDEIGMISLTWLEKFEYFLPGLIIQMTDITDLITDIQNININQICEPIIKNINLIKSVYPQSYQLIIIKNFKRVSGLENNVKNFVTNSFSVKNNIIFFVNDMLYHENKNIIKQIGKLIIENIFGFYNFKINYYLNKYNNQRNNEQKEYAVKYLIKTFLLAKVSNIILNNKNINYYDYINNAYNILIILDKHSYMFSNNNLKSKYLEIKNLADFLLNEIMTDKSINNKNIINLILNHIYNFDSKNFYNDKSNDNKNINKIKDFQQYKDINFINYKWKLFWLKYLSEINKNNNNNNIDKNNILNYNILNNYYHIYILLKNDPNFTQDICSKINKEIVTKKINPKYFEKVPKLYEMDGDNITGLLSDDENLGIYISDLIMNDKNLLNPEYILKQIKEFFIKNKLNYYDFYILNKHCKDNEYNEDFNKILIQILNTNNNNIFKFPKVYSHISNKINKIILDLKYEKNENECAQLYFKIIEHLLLYSSISSKELSDEQIIKLNNILSGDNIIEGKNTIIHLNNLENKLFDIKINYNTKEVNLLDVININIDISLLRKNLILNIEKIIIYFPKNKSNKEENKNHKELIMNKDLSQDNHIQINFNYLINCYLSKLYVTNIELYLQNKLIINIFNKDKKDIILYNKNNNKININDIINFDFFNKKNKDNIILIGKDENHLLNIKYNLKNDNKDIFIKNIKINIQLLKQIETQEKKKWENANNYEFIILEGTSGYLIIDNKELYYEFDNLNLDKNLPLIEFLIKVKELGNYKLNYKFHFVLINNNCPEEKCILECNKNVLVHCIESFDYKNEINSSLYFINPQNNIKSYPINYPINIISYLENKLSEKIIITKVVHITNDNNNFIEINCPTEKLFSKIKNFQLKFSKNEIISISAKLISKSEISDSLGKLNIFWVSEDLYKNNRFSEIYINQSSFDLSEININILSLSIEGKYLKMCNKYQIGIKNMETISKLIQLDIKEENENKKYILCGKTNLNSILTPNKEIKILYNIYNAITGMNIDEIIENKVHKFDNVITVNEYYIFDNKDKFKSKSLKNTIYFTPELFKL